jgi:hypothetical protein
VTEQRKVSEELPVRGGKEILIYLFINDFSTHLTGPSRAKLIPVAKSAVCLGKGHWGTQIRVKFQVVGSREHK